MLSGPPPAFAAPMSAVQISCRLRLVSPRISAICGSPTTENKPSEQMRYRSPGCGLDLGQIDFGIFTAGQRARDDVPPRMLTRGGRAHRPGANLLLDPRVIVRQLVQLAVSQAIDAAVADVRHARRRCAGKERRRGRRHAAQLARIGDRRGDLPVGEAKGSLETVGFEAERGFERKGPGAVLVRTRRVRDECLDGIHGLPRRDLAGDVAAHAVGDDKQPDVGPFAMTVFIAGATQTLVRRNGPAERQRTRGAHGRRQPYVRTCLSAPVR